MKVETEFEIKHFVDFINTNNKTTTLIVDGVDGGFYIANMDGETFEISKNALCDIMPKCLSMKLINNIAQ